LDFLYLMGTEWKLLNKELVEHLSANQHLANYKFTAIVSRMMRRVGRIMEALLRLLKSNTLI